MRVFTVAKNFILRVVAKLVSLVFNVRLRHNAISVKAKTLLVFVISIKNPIGANNTDWLW